MIQSLLFFLVIITTSSCHVLLQTANGDVSRGNFIYWSLSYHGNIVVQLISLKEYGLHLFYVITIMKYVFRSGDTDLYVSERIAKPDYEPDKYDLHSASCGIDTVHIPSSFKRPVGIGIYGHPSYENSTYLLEIYFEDEDEINYETEIIGDTYQSNNDEKTNDSKTRFKVTKSMILSGFWAVMEILELLFS